MYFPLSAPDGQEYHTLLTDGPRYVVYNPLNIYYLTVEHPSALPCIPGQKTTCLVKMSDHRMKPKFMFIMKPFPALNFVEIFHKKLTLPSNCPTAW